MKKSVSIISLLLALLLVFSTVGTLGVFADGEEEGYSRKEVTGYIFSLESEKTFECIFKNALPEVPYIDVLDYLNVVFIDEFGIAKNEDGTYTVTSSGGTMDVDPEKDVISFDCYEDFTDCEINEEGSSIEIPYINGGYGDFIGEPQGVTIDFAPYGIDIIEDGGRIYLPLATIAVMFSSTYINAVYFEESICFVHTFDPESYYDELDQSSLYEKTTRTKAMAQFTYGNLCFSMDYFYGKPSNTLLAEDLKTKTFDQALNENSDFTRTAKDLLLSEDLSEYFCGIAALGYYLYDGGHTVLLNIPVISINYYMDTPLGSKWAQIIYSDSELSDYTWSAMDPIFDSYDAFDAIYETRTAEYGKYDNEIVKEWEDTGAFLIIHGKTAVYVFDSFEIETANEFKEALDIAKEKGVENFVLDDSNNGGGYVAALEYIGAIMTNKKNRSNTFHTEQQYTLSGNMIGFDVEVDLNLDGEFNDEDKDVVYDFRFGVLTSGAAFSCGNELPVFAKANGIAVLGQTSGGGSCVVTERYLADGFAYPVSDILKNVMEDMDIDLGAQPDFDLVEYDDEGNADYSKFYDIDLLGSLLEEFYPDEPVIPDDPDDPVNPPILDTGVDPLPAALMISSVLLLAAVLVLWRSKRRETV